MKSVLSLPTTVEERLSGWTRIQERRAASKTAPTPRPTITISRQFGCEGFPLSIRLQALLEKATGEAWSIFDKALVERVAQDAEVQLFKELKDPTRYLESFGFHPKGPVTSDEIFHRMAVLVLRFAREGNAIIVGRGGAILCKDLDNCFHFRLEAGLEWRIRSMAERMDLTGKEAADMVRAQSKLRESFVRDYLGVEVGESAYYDATFNNERHSVGEIAAAILAYVRSGWKGKGFLPG